MDGNTFTTDTETTETMRQRAVTEWAMAEVKREQKLREGEGLAIMFAAMSFKDATDTDTLLGKAAHISQLICILFVFAMPCYLFWSVILNG